MKRSLLIVFYLFLVSNLRGAEGEAVPDRIHVRGGAIIVGTILDTDAALVRVRTDYAGVINLNLGRIEKVVLGAKRELILPAETPVFTEIYLRQLDSQENRTPAVASSQEVKEERKGWRFEGGFNLAGKSGNAERFDLAFSGEAVLERELDRINFYGKYLYGTNNEVRSADEIVLGGRYTSFVFKKFGFFLRQELEQDEFEGILLRSTTASGVTFRLERSSKLSIEARTGFSYRYENYLDDGSEDFPGMDFGFDVNWHFVKWARFKGSYTFLPSIDDFNDFIIEQDTGFNLPLDDGKIWKLRLGVTSYYNNQPDVGREKLDLRYYARFIATWN